MTEMPFVQLNAGGPVGDLDFTRSPEQAMISGMLATRDYLTREARQQVKTMPVINPVSLTQVLDSIWKHYLPTFRQTLGPQVAAAYLKGYQQAQAGDVDPVIINALAEQFTDKVGDYFHYSSREAVVSSFNTFVNRKIPARAAAERALEGYGLTPRQINGLSTAQFDGPVNSTVSLDLKRRMKAYIGKSLKQRLAIFATQEAHNLDEQARQMAWLYLVKNGNISPDAEKVWITARDERVCKVCGPMHGKRVLVTERFETPDGPIWTPGLHVNCRCEVRLVDVPAETLSVFGKADDRWYNDEYKRTSDGRFAAARRRLEEQQKNPRFRVKERTGDVEGFQNLLDHMFDDIKEEAPPEKLKSAEKLTTHHAEKLTSKPKLHSKGKLSSKSTTEGKIQITPAKQRLIVRRNKLGDRGVLRAYPQHVQSKNTARMLASVEQSIFDLKQAKVEPVKDIVRYRPTVDIVKLTGSPVYAVVPGWMLDVDGQLQLDESIEFIDDEKRVAMQAAEDFNDEIAFVVEGIYNAEDPPSILVEVDGQMKQAYISEEDVWEFVSNTAWEDRHDDPDWSPMKQTYELVVQDDSGDYHPIEERISHAMAQDAYGLHPEMFRQVIVRMDEGYDSPEQGKTYQAASGTGYGYEIWQTQGTYDTQPTGAHHQVAHHAPRIETVILRPQVDDTVVDQNTGTILNDRDEGGSRVRGND